jgi:hypothetical protein
LNAGVVRYGSPTSPRLVSEYKKINVIESCLTYPKIKLKK